MKNWRLVLAKGFIEDLGEAVMNLALIGFLCILGIQYILGNWLVSIGMLSIPNLIFKSFIFPSSMLMILELSMFINAS